MFAQIAIEDAVHDFTDVAFTANSNLSVCKSSTSHQPPASACMKGNESSKTVNVVDPTEQEEASSFAFLESMCTEKFSKLEHGDEENIMGVNKFLEPCVSHDISHIDVSGISGVSKPLKQLDDGWKVVDEVVDAAEANMGTACPKLVQDIQMKNPSRSRRKQETKKVVLSLNLLPLTRRKRSKRVRSTTWAELGNIASALKQRGGTTPTPEKPKRSRRASGSRGSRRRDSSISVRNAEKLKETRRVPSGPICLKVKFGNNSIMDIITKVEDKNGIPKVTYEKTCKAAPVLLEKRESENIKSKPLAENPEIASDVDIVGNLGSSTRCEFPFQANVTNFGAAADSNVLDTGTSPDSEIINTVPDAQVSCKDAEDLHSPTGRYASPNSETPIELFNSDKDRKTDVLCATSGGCPKGEMPSLGNLNNAEEFASRGLKGNKADTSYANGASSLATAGIASSRASDGNCVSQTVPSSGGGDITNCHRTSDVEKNVEKGLHVMCDNGKAGETGKGNKIGGMSRTDTVPGVVGGENMPPRNAWVSCDDCHKWRRIPALLADEIEESNCSWVCKDNMDRRFADCLIPQEKSNEDINAELEISDEEDYSNISSGMKSIVTENSSWTPIKSNLFLNRRRKNQSIDEIMVCSCKQPADGRMGCGRKCLNRMLNIECISGMCPCGESCSNQQFQKREYAQLKSMRCGKKGFGLHLLEDVSEGKFLIEYVGEVLDMHAYEARQREYAAKGHRHFYFMTLNGSEVIDACAKGNLGRFINHSCDPNCRTEKWMVNGEVCVGIFSLRDIKKGEELTFDYNYVRVFGAAAKKCVCGSSQCRGYIGGDPLNSEIIEQGDSDEEYPEPCFVHNVGETDKAPSTVVSTSAPKEKRGGEVPEKADNMDESLSTSGQAGISSEESKEMFIHDKVEIESPSMAAGSSEITKESTKSPETPFSPVFTPQTSSENKSSELQVSLTQPEENFSPENDESSFDTYTVPDEECSETEISKDSSSLITISGKLSDTTDNFVKSKSDEEGGIAISKLHSKTKVAGRVSSAKKKKPKSDIATEKKTPEIHNKSHPVPTNPKMPLASPNTGRFDAVQEKLNVLLDPYGGISKRKDASRGYLKLLLLTAATGDNGNVQGIQRNRGLSMILDALLKTKSRTVLVDIINKNGLQMLHNIMKRCRKEHNKIPILRKLLKALEYLATREILTSEYINGGPRCPGMESFKDSILKLAEHPDKQVHLSARNFRDRWIPRCFRKFGSSIERDGGRTESHVGPNKGRFSAARYPCNDLAGNHPPDTPNSSAKCEAEIPERSTESRFKRRRKSRWDVPGIANGDTVGTAVAMVEDVPPPGFSSPLKYPVNNNNTSTSFRLEPEVATGYSKARFNSRLPVAYGVPVSVVQNLGVQHAESSGSWIVSPGIPFQAFPPLPPYPRDRTEYPSNQGFSISEQDHHRGNDAAPFCPSQYPSCAETTVGNQMDLQQHHRGSCNNLSGRYFRQTKPKNPKLPPPWARNRNSWAPPVMNGPRNGACHPEFGSAPNSNVQPPHNGNPYNHQHMQQQQPPPPNWS